MIRGALASVARNESLGGLISRTPLARDVVKRVVGGDSIEAALAVAYELADRGYWISLERAAGESAVAQEVFDEYARLIDGIGVAGLSGVCEVAVLPEALGVLPADPSPVQSLARQAAEQGVAFMLGIGADTDADASLSVLDGIRAAGLPAGVTLPAARRRTEADCQRLADGRVRLVKGGRGGTPAQAFAQPIEIDKAFVRSAKRLLAGMGDPSFATHDPRLIEIVESLAVRYQRADESFEFTFFMGRQEGAQERLLAAGHRVRVYVPYGPDWFERLVGGLAEQPSSITAALRSLLPGAS